MIYLRIVKEGVVDTPSRNKEKMLKYFSHVKKFAIVIECHHFNLIKITKMELNDGKKTILNMYISMFLKDFICIYIDYTLNKLDTSRLD